MLLIITSYPGVARVYFPSLSSFKCLDISFESYCRVCGGKIGVAIACIIKSLQFSIFITFIWTNIYIEPYIKAGLLVWFYVVIIRMDLNFTQSAHFTPTDSIIVDMNCE